MNHNDLGGYDLSDSPMGFIGGVVCGRRAYITRMHNLYYATEDVVNPPKVPHETDSTPVPNIVEDGVTYRCVGFAGSQYATNGYLVNHGGDRVWVQTHWRAIDDDDDVKPRAGLALLDVFSGAVPNQATDHSMTLRDSWLINKADGTPEYWDDTEKLCHYKSYSASDGQKKTCVGPDHFVFMDRQRSGSKNVKLTVYTEGVATPTVHTSPNPETGLGLPATDWTLMTVCDHAFPLSLFVHTYAYTATSAFNAYRCGRLSLASMILVGDVASGGSSQNAGVQQSSYSNPDYFTHEKAIAKIFDWSSFGFSFATYSTGGAFPTSAARVSNPWSPFGLNLVDVTVGWYGIGSAAQPDGSTSTDFYQRVNTVDAGGSEVVPFQFAIECTDLAASEQVTVSVQGARTNVGQYQFMRSDGQNKNGTQASAYNVKSGDAGIPVGTVGLGWQSAGNVSPTPYSHPGYDPVFATAHDDQYMGAYPGIERNLGVTDINNAVLCHNVWQGPGIADHFAFPALAEFAFWAGDRWMGFPSYTNDEFSRKYCPFYSSPSSGASTSIEPPRGTYWSGGAMTSSPYAFAYDESLDELHGGYSYHAQWFQNS